MAGVTENNTPGPAPVARQPAASTIAASASVTVADAARAARARSRLPRVLACAALFVVAAGFAWTRHAGPVPLAWYPPCPLHAVTGIFCPGCGSARVLHDLAHGNIRAACGHNILLAAAIPLLALWAALALWRGVVRNQPPPHPPLGVARIVLVVVVVFWIARNLPWWPFALLAPAS